MAWIGAVASVAGTAINANAKKAQAAALMGSGGGPVESVFDNSGWNVSIGGGRIDSTAYKTTDQSAGQPASAGAAGYPLMTATAAGDSTLMYAGIALLALMLWKKKH